ncbi:WXG100 family type VII secretion target [Nocardia terpenica]|uniref:WXG100 family type VII secretion target n=1 Tax=Nocardia terpenica TaxID=455432 RepID=A0A6G9YZV1_9NOCA|nr:WXG100 family type VII secretion target [Nocardia terpenica]QIS18744.1 WXG100 family type VII secretion target [Nocardia terpenica]
MADTPGLSGGQGSTPLAVVPTEVADAGRFVQETAENLIRGIHSADADIQGLMDTWHGTAADTYLKGWEETRRGALEVLDALSAMADLLGVTAATFTETDQGNAQLLQRISSLNL